MTTAKKEPCSVDKKTVLILNGSPNKNGNTVKLISAFKTGLPENITVIDYDCYTHMPKPCSDCKVCHKTRKCAFDDLDNYYKMLENADAIVYASPVYNLSFTSPLKNIIDRGQRYWAARFIRNETFPNESIRPAVLITSAGSKKSPDEFNGPGQMLQEQLIPALTVLSARLIDCVHHEGSDYENDITPMLSKAKTVAQNLFKF